MTPQRQLYTYKGDYFNPHPPYGGWLCGACEGLSGGDFNPHPPYGGWPRVMRMTPLPKEFQSTPSVWRVTTTDLHKHRAFCDFNPHPPYGGWRVNYYRSAPQMHFNPHPPYGGWRDALNIRKTPNWFQSTPSVWRVTTGACICNQCVAISIHTLRMEGDSVSTIADKVSQNFNPHPPYGGWHSHLRSAWTGFEHFNPHPPYGGWR